jgi:hypothetical protein
MSSVMTAAAPLGKLHAAARVEPGKAPDTVLVVVGIAKELGAEPIASSEPTVTVYDADHRPLVAKQLHVDQPNLVEAVGAGVTANAFFEVQVPNGAQVDEIEIGLRQATARLSVPRD